MLRRPVDERALKYLKQALGHLEISLIFDTYAIIRVLGFATCSLQHAHQNPQRTQRDPSRLKSFSVYSVRLGVYSHANGHPFSADACRAGLGLRFFASHVHSQANQSPNNRGAARNPPAWGRSPYMPLRSHCSSGLPMAQLVSQSL